jgi:hypothetical protein
VKELITTEAELAMRLPDAARKRMKLGTASGNLRTDFGAEAEHNFQGSDYLFQPTQNWRIANIERSKSTLQQTC